MQQLKEPELRYRRLFDTAQDGNRAKYERHGQT